MRSHSRKVCLGRGMSHAALRFVTRLARSSGKRALRSELWQQLGSNQKCSYSSALFHTSQWKPVLKGFFPLVFFLCFPSPVGVFQLCYSCNSFISNASRCSAKSIKLQLLPPSSACSWTDRVADIPERSKAWQLKMCSLMSVPNAHKSEVILGLCGTDSVFRLKENAFYSGFNFSLLARSNICDAHWQLSFVRSKCCFHPSKTRPIMSDPVQILLAAKWTKSWWKVFLTWHQNSF